MNPVSPRNGASRWLARSTLALLLGIPPVLAFQSGQAADISPRQAPSMPIPGTDLAREIAQAAPTPAVYQGHLLFRSADGSRQNLPLTLALYNDGDHSWTALYQAGSTSAGETLWIKHLSDGSLQMRFAPGAVLPKSDFKLHQHPDATGGLDISTPEPGGKNIVPGDWMKSFAGSDFSPADLGLVFLHWPRQTILRRETHRSRGCTVLESVQLDAPPGGYVRVVSWVDDETHGILEAWAYDQDGHKVKEFYPKDFKKVNGQWQVQTLIMDNMLTGSRSRMEWDLKN